MPQVFGYKDLSAIPSGRPTPIRPDFHPTEEFIDDDTAVFLSVNLSKRSEDFTYESSDLLVVVVGNIYLKEDLGSKYPELERPQDSGCAAVVAYLYRHYGRDEVAKLSGDFILIIKEKRAEKLILIRDRMGGRKLFYTVSSGSLIFASQLKTLIAIHGVSRDLDHFALESFLKFGYIIAPTTIFKSIRELEPGQLIECGKGNYNVVQYWRLRPSDEIELAGDDLRKALYKNIEQAIAARFNPRERIGIYLSGGVDSNTLLAVLSRMCDPSKIHTVSIGYGEQYKDYHELSQARLGAAYFGSSHHELINGPEHIDAHLCRMVWQFEQPFGNPALISWVSLSDLAKDLVDVVFVGAGADEVLGGYKRYNALMFLRRYYGIPCSSLLTKAFQAPLSRLSVGANHYSVINRLQKFSQSIHPDILKTNEAFLFGDYDELRTNLFLPNFRKASRGAEPSLVPYYFSAGTSDPLRQIFIADCYSNLVSEQLSRALIPLAEWDVDYRAPFSDPDFLEFCLNIPNRCKAGFLRTKILYKEAVKNILPSQIMTQKKRGMSHPVAFWFQGALHEKLLSVLSSKNPALVDYFDVNHLRRLAQEHHSRKRNWGELLWKMVVFSMWHKIFVENKSTGMPDFRLSDIVATQK